MGEYWCPTCGKPVYFVDGKTEAEWAEIEEKHALWAREAQAETEEEKVL